MPARPRTDAASADELNRQRGVEVFERNDGALLALAVVVRKREVDGGLQRRDPALAVAAVGRDDDLRAGVVDA